MGKEWNRLIETSSAKTDPLVKKAAEILKRGGVGAFPTETVYGLGANVFDRKAVARIFAIKGRPSDNPLIVHIAEREQLQILADDIPAVTAHLIETFWPGPLTLVLKRAVSVPDIVSANLPTVAVRMPNHKVALELIQALNAPIAAPSANRSGRPSPTSARAVHKELGTDADFILDGGDCAVGLESTVLDLTAIPPKILRPGGITAEQLISVIGEVVPYSKENQSGLSPGQKHAHYTPALKLILVEPNAWQDVLQKALPLGEKIGVISLKEVSSLSLVYIKVMVDIFDYAKNLFAALYEAEAKGVEVLFVEKVAKEGVGVAIMDRLERAAGFAQS